MKKNIPFRSFQSKWKRLKDPYDSNCVDSWSETDYAFTLERTPDYTYAVGIRQICSYSMCGWIYAYIHTHGLEFVDMR